MAPHTRDGVTRVHTLYSARSLDITRSTRVNLSNLPLSSLSFPHSSCPALPDRWKYFGGIRLQLTMLSTTLYSPRCKLNDESQSNAERTPTVGVALQVTCCQSFSEYISVFSPCQREKDYVCVCEYVRGLFLCILFCLYFSFYCFLYRYLAFVIKM